MNPDNRKFITTVVGSALILIAVFAFVLMQLLNPKETPSEQTVSAFPESGDRTDVRPIRDEAYVGFETATTGVAIETITPAPAPLVDAATIPEALQNNGASDWRDDIVEYSGQATAVSEDTTIPRSRPTYSKDDLIASGALSDYDIYSTLITAPETVTLAGREISTDALKDQTLFFDAVNPFPSLVSSFAGVASCGTIQMSSDVLGAAKFFSNLAAYPESTCLGKAIVNDCSSAWALVYTPEGMKVWVYVAKRSDGVCSVGTTSVQEYVNLCAVTDVAFVATGKRLLISEWQEMYTNKPAELFAKIYSSESAITNLSGLDCENTRVK
jgi:hypothetical protein